MADAPTIDQRKAEVRRRLTIGAVINGHVKLTGSPSSRKRRGKCEFHGSNSLSFSVNDADSGDGVAHCFGCGWHGDMFRFVMDLKGWPFMEALAELERMAGIGEGGGDIGAARGMVTRARAPQPPRRPAEREPVDSIEMGRWIWRHARRDDRAVARYFMGRGIPEAILAAERLTQFRYIGNAPCWAWRQGETAETARGMLTAPAVVALVREPRRQDAVLRWPPVGVHVTYLNPDGTGTMKRRAPWAEAGDADPWLPKRRMLGPTGRGCVLLGAYRPEARLWIGEGNETVLSGMAIGGAAAADVGVATLSLDNLQGGIAKWRNNVWPLFDVRPDPERPCFLIPGHRGAVTGLIDSDMSPLRGQRVRGPGGLGGGFAGELVVERKGGGIVRRAITGPERARICGELFVKGWRAAGCAAEAMRAPVGMDFNDAIQEAV